MTGFALTVQKSPSLQTAVEGAACLAAVMKPAEARPHSAVVTSAGGKMSLLKGHN